MQKESRFWKFWTTLPGFLTAIAALLTAIVGAYGIFGPKPNQPVKVVSGPVQSGAREPQPSPSTPPSVTPDHANATATITESDGSNITVRASSLVWNPSITLGEIGLSSGQSIALDKIKAIDVLSVEDTTTRVRVTLLDSKVIESSLTGGRVDLGTRFEGESDVGKVSIRISLVKRIAFQR
jgi:hypothetical protein